MSFQRTDLFDSSKFDRGAPLYKEILWHVCKSLFFLTSIPWPSTLKRNLLVLFGAKIGPFFYIRPRVNIHFPWKFRAGRHCWIGDRCEILNLEPVVFGDYVALAHDVYIAAASHDISSISMKYKNAPIFIQDSVWIATRAFIGAGVTIGVNSVVGACCPIFRDIPPNTVVTFKSHLHTRPRSIHRL